MHKKKDIKIHPYEGEDAFYSGSDDEYEEFLRTAEVSVDYGKEAESVENTQRINLNDTINIQHVIDRFRKTAGGLGHTARSVKDSLVSKMDSIKAKKEETQPSAYEGVDLSEADADHAEEAAVSASAVKQEPDVPQQSQDTTHQNAQMPDTEQLEALISEASSGFASRIEFVLRRLDEIESRLCDSAKESTQSSETIQDTIDAVGDGISEIKQAVGSISRLNDSVFDLKNTQLNTKNSISGLETSFARLKRKCVLGVTVISILSAIIIALEVLLLLS